MGLDIRRACMGVCAFSGQMVSSPVRERTARPQLAQSQSTRGTERRNTLLEGKRSSGFPFRRAEQDLKAGELYRACGRRCFPLLQGRRTRTRLHTRNGRGHRDIRHDYGRRNGLNGHRELHTILKARKPRNVHVLQLPPPESRLQERGQVDA